MEQALLSFSLHCNKLQDRIKMRKDTIQGITGQTHYNLVMLGDVKSGKTALVSQYMFDSLKPAYKPTIEDCYRTLAKLPSKYNTVKYSKATLITQSQFFVSKNIF